MHRLVEVAKQYVGQTELPGNRFTDSTPLGRLVHGAGQKDGEAWCAYFVEGCAIEAYPELKQQLTKFFDASAVKSYHNFKAAGFKTTTTDPIPGDIVVFQRYHKGVAQWQGHMAIVEAVMPGRGFITIEGNTNDLGSREGIMVADGRKRDYKFNPNGLTLLGFIRI